MKFLRYIKKVYHFYDIVKGQKDFRKKQGRETGVIFTIVFWSFVLRVQSFNELEQMINYGCFDPLFPRRTKLPSVDTIGRALAKWDLKILQESFERINFVLFKNKTFQDGTIDGYTVCAIDGTDVINTGENRKCSGCIFTKNADGYHYAHKSVVAMVIGDELNFVLKHCMLKVESEKEKVLSKTLEKRIVTKSEGELTGAMKLIKELPSGIDVIVADSLYFNAPFIKEVKRNLKHAVIRLQDKTRNIYDEICHEAQYHTCKDIFVCKDNFRTTTVSYWFKDTMIADSTLLKNDPEKYTDMRIYKFTEVIESHVKGEEKFLFREVYVGTTDKNMTPETVWRIVHKRWYIENTCFHLLKTYCNMEHCFKHDETAIEAILYIMFMAYNLLRAFLFKRLRNFKKEYKDCKATISWFVKELLFELICIRLLIKLKIVEADFIEASCI